MNNQSSPRPNIRLSKELCDLLNEKLYVEAKILLELAISNPDTSPLVRFSALNTLACVYLRLGHKSEALQLINTALTYKANMNNIQLICTLINLSGILSASNDHESACKYLRKTLEYITHYAEQEEFLALILYNLSIELKFLKKNEESVTYLEKGWRIINTHLRGSHLCDLYKAALPKTTKKILSLNFDTSHEDIKKLHPRKRHARSQTFTNDKGKMHSLSPRISISTRHQSFSFGNNDSILKKPMIASTTSMKTSSCTTPMSSMTPKRPSIKGSTPNFPRKISSQNRIRSFTTLVDSLEPQMAKFTNRVLKRYGEIGDDVKAYYLMHVSKIEKVQRVVRIWLRKRFRAATVIQKAFRKYKENHKVVRFRENPLFVSAKQSKVKRQSRVLIKKIRK